MQGPNSRSGDLESPGYEFLRSYRSMSNLYHKLIALNYQKEFCPLYKCPPVHKYYFSYQSTNQMEQQFSFMCLCVWLIKDKCLMNFDTDPRDYQDFESTLSVIYEAINLLMTTDDEGHRMRQNMFPVGRLKRGFGPEVIFCLNKFADRAIELIIMNEPGMGQAEINYQNKQRSDRDQGRPIKSITIGQPIVGGGLTTRPLGNYQVADSSLMLGNDDDNTVDTDESLPTSNDEWRQESFDKVAPMFGLDHEGKNARHKDFSDLLANLKISRKVVQGLSDEAKPILENLVLMVEEQTRIIAGREASIQTTLRAPFERFLTVWGEFSILSDRNSTLIQTINSKTNEFERYVERLKETRSKRSNSNDTKRLQELDLRTKCLNSEAEDIDLKLNLLLASSCRS